MSRGEENTFIWCFFLAIVQLTLIDDEASPYSWVKYIYIDDPISSLDDNNTVAIAHHLAQLLKKNKKSLKVIVSSHHTLFFNVMCNEWGNAAKYFLSKGGSDNGYSLKTMYGDTARFYHVAMLRELKAAADTNKLYTYHFNILRNIMEKTATFHGYTDFSHFIKVEDDDDEKTLLTRLIQVLNHGGYSLMEPTEMLPENKKIL
ncbi:AAA family ATPase [Pseudoalteromonas distincta]|uniref:AAA family ATPase n=1 Tax=Pseudoalteromonas distincta TaxID=77608 RepID=UPI0002DEEFDD|nr:AAA family ATPase [Pseudoalteromonas distincta]